VSMTSSMIVQLYDNHVACTRGRPIGWIMRLSTVGWEG